MDAEDLIPERRGESEAMVAYEIALDLRVDSEDSPQDLVLAVRWCAAEVHLLNFLVDLEHERHMTDLREVRDHRRAQRERAKENNLDDGSVLETEVLP